MSLGNTNRTNNQILPEIVAPDASPWRSLLRLRWPLGAAIAVAFALGQFAEAALWGRAGGGGRLILDVIGWGLLGGIAVWASLTWVSRQEQRHQTAVERALHDQQRLNYQLQQANQDLALLSDVNRTIADSSTIDEILDAALHFPQRLIPFEAASLLLNDSGVWLPARTIGMTPNIVAQRQAEGLFATTDVATGTPQISTTSDGVTRLQLPLRAGPELVGLIDLYLAPEVEVLPSSLGLLETIGGELAEGIVGARRRSQEERALWELEQAIADERARIARDIHDGIAQTLAFRRMRIDLWLDWINTDRDRLRQELIENKQLLRDQIAELRRAIWALRPVQFDELGFIGGLHHYITEFANQQAWIIEIDLSAVPPGLSSATEALCFRVIQESLTNAAKHAKAHKVVVRLEHIDNGLQITVQDDGGGFAPDSVVSQGGNKLGLRQMEERVRGLRGQLTVLARPGAGTEVRAWLPLPEA